MSFLPVSKEEARSTSPCGDTVEAYIQALSIKPEKLSPPQPTPLDLAPLTRTPSDIQQNGPTTPTAATCNLTLLGSYFDKFSADLLWQHHGQSKPAVADDGSSIDGIMPEAPTLNNAIHAIFSREKFEGLRYEVLTPVLRLATALLGSADSKQYLYAALLSPVVDVHYADNQPEAEATDATEEQKPTRTYKALFRKGAPLTAEEDAQAEAKLLEMASFVTFDMYITDTDRGTHPDGCCEPCPDIKTTSICGPDGKAWEGTASTISLNKASYDDLCALFDATNVKSPGYQKDQLLLQLFQLARVLCHELMHAIKCARFDADAVAIGFETQRFAEDGYDWEAAVFGGIVGSARGQQRTARMSEWPSPAVFENYMRHNDGGEMFVARPPPPEEDVDRHWQVPPSFVRALFQQSSWKEKEGLGRVGGLQVPKLLGYRTIPCAERGVCRCITCQVTEATVQLYVERRSGKAIPDDVWHARRTEVMCTRRAEIVEKARLEQREAYELVRAVPGVNCSGETKEGEIGIREGCDRMNWGPWPFGEWDTRAHGASKDVKTYGVPEGYVSLLDGTLVRKCDELVMTAMESLDLEKDVCKAKALISELEAEQEEGFPGESEKGKAHLVRLIGILEEMLKSEDPVARRLVSGVKEVALFFEDDSADDDESSNGDDEAWEDDEGNEQ